MAKNNDGLIPLVIGAALLYFNSTVQICTGWQIVNPLCWGGSFLTHSIMLIGGIVLILIGIIKFSK